MTPEIFSTIAELRLRLLQEEYGRPGAPGDIFIPWAGKSLREHRGIYVIGIALDAAPARKDQTFAGRLEWTEEMCDRRHDKGGTPFWAFLDSLTRQLLGGPYYATADRWGWSNLLKICWSEGRPDQWPRNFKNLQRQVSALAVQEELANLSRSLIFVASNNDFGILDSLGMDRGSWNKEDPDKSGIWWRPGNKGNLWVYGYHPGYARRGKFYDAALERTVELARAHLPAFS